MKILENLALSIILYSAFNLMPVFAATSITLSYDATGKLESAVRSDGPRISYAYDAANNFTSVSSNHPTDSDGDKIPDELEVAYGLNISLMDSDSDGTLDYSEVCFDSNCSDYNPYDSIANPTGTDLHANKVDTDGDGYTDSTEIFLGTDPLNANIFPSGIPVDEWYTLLNPGLVGAEVWVVSLSDNNKIRVGDTVITLNRYERGQIPEGILTQGMVISGTGPFDLGGSVSATDVPLSNRLAGTRFVLPQIRKTHLYYLVSPDGDATVQVDVNGVVTPLTLPQGQVVEFNAGYDTTGSALINSDLPILVAHRGDAGSYFTDAAPVPPAALELWGVRTYGAAYLSASEDNTTVNIYADNGSSVSNVVLNAGDRYRINTVGVPGTQGTGSGLRIIADKPVGAIQIADGDGSDETAFFPTSQLGIRFGLPTTTQYVAVVCPIANTTVTLYDGLNPPQSITCSANGLNPGKAYFGSQTNGSNIMAGAYLEADQPVYLMYEDALTNDEQNVMGQALGYTYTILNPGLVGAEVWVVSLSDNNKIRVGDTVITLNRYERGQIPEGILTQGMVISGTGPFDLGGSVSATDVPLSNRLAGTRFVLPQIRKTHLYYLVSPDGDATVQVDVNGVVTPLTLPQGQVVEFNAGYDTTGSALINSDLPILVAHRGDAGSYFTDAAPVPPAALELWGVRTYGAAYLSASEDNTTVNIYADNGSSVSNVVLNAGDRYRINTVGVPGTQGTGSGLRIIADKPVGAIQIADGDGSDETAFFPTSQLGIRFGLPTTTQYVAVVCPIANTTVTLYDGLNPPQSITCSANGLNPGKAYFGSQTNGSNIMAGAYLEADQPVYLMYEDALTNDEHNLFGSP